jgi:hypothetical protein
MTETLAPPTTLEEARKLLTEAEYAELEELLREKAAVQLFVPTPKQLEVVNSTADVVGYGGAAGGGKSYLMTGLTIAHHQRSAIIRPQKNQTKKFVAEIAKMLGTRNGYNSQDSDWRFMTPDKIERYVKFYGLDNPGDEEKQQGEDFDAKLYDEVTQMREEDIRYTLTWNRTDDPTQRVRAVLAFNPPTTPEGRWVIRYFAPWLDPAHPNPAKDGEIRYFTTIGDDRDYEVASGQQFIIRRVRGREVPWYRFDPKDHTRQEIITPESRTFIHAKVTDNPYYMKTNYLQKLQALPEPLRSQMMNGDFFAGMEDDARQVIPTRWVLLAQQRWKERHALISAGAAKLPPQDSLGVDVARGGNMGGAEVAAGADELVISPRYGTFFDEQKIFKGIDINDGAKAAALIVGERRDEAPIHLDVAGVGTSPYDFLRANNIFVIAVNNATTAHGTDASGLLKFANKRAETYWRMREALDPMLPEPIAIPPDQQLLVDLTSARWTLTQRGITLEPKDDIKKRLGRSPDRGEALILANIDTPKREMLIGSYRLAPGTRSRDYEQQRLKELEA